MTDQLKSSKKIKKEAVNSKDYDIIKMHLLNIDFFQKLPRQTLNALLKVAIVRTFKPGEKICEEGISDPYIHVIYQGQAMYKKKYKLTLENQKNQVFQKEDILVGFKYPAAIIGLTGLILQNDQHTVTFSAKTECKIVSFSNEDCYNILIKNSEISNLMLKHFAQRIRKSNVKFAEMIAKTENPDIKKIAFFDSKDYMRNAFEKVLKNEQNLKFEWIESKLNINTVVLAKGCNAVCVFVNDSVSFEVLGELKSLGISMIALRSTGYNNIDLQACRDLDISCCRVTSYSPYAIAEHATALLLALNRKIPVSQYKIKTHNFQLGGLVGMDLFQKTIGVIGTGKIGMKAIDIFKGFGMKVLAYDVYPDKSKESEQLQYVDLDTLYKKSDIIALFCPLLDSTFHLINDATIAKMKDGVIIINTSRGPVVDTTALINGLKSGKIAGAGLDVIEGEQEYFFEDYSNKIIINDNLNRLLSFNNVIVTGHQAFLTHEALDNIATTTIENFKAYFKGARGKELPNNVLLL